MNKQKLSAIPRPELTEKQKEMVLLVPHMSYLVTAERKEISGEDTLIMNFFQYEKKKLSPAFRTFCQKDDYISQDLKVKNTKWKTGAINYLTGYMYWYRKSGNIVIASVEERKTILDFLYEFKERHHVKDYMRYVPYSDGTVVDSEIEDRIDEYQNQIKEWKLEKKHKKLMDEIDEQMKKFGEIPQDYDSFVENTVFDDEHYIFYSREKSEAYCTRCKLTYEVSKKGYLRHKKIPIWNDVDKVKHNHMVCCPHCGKYIMCKSEGISRGGLYKIEWSVLIQKYGEEALIRYFCHSKDFRKDYRNPVIQTNELYRTVHTEQRSRDYMMDRFMSTNIVRWCNYRERSYGWSTPSEEIVPRRATLYNTDLNEAVQGTCMKYSALDLYINKVVKNSNDLSKPWCIDWYFNSYRKMPYLEQLLKVGFFRMTQQILEEHNAPEFKAGKSIVETLGINRIQFKMLMNLKNPDVRDLEILKYAGTIRDEDFRTLRNIPDSGYLEMYKKYIDLMEYTSLHKIMKYFEKAKLVGKENNYFDYIRWIKELGYDMRNEFNLYPKHFQKSHDDKSKEYQAYQDKKKREEMKRFNTIIEQMKNDKSEISAFNLHYKDLFIRLPVDAKEIRNEGQMLHHCVGNYIERVAKAETLIFFIRKESNPEKPFFTLEWKGSVVQCHGMKDCDPTDEVNEFIKVFTAKMLEYEESINAKKRRKAG